MPRIHNYNSSDTSLRASERRLEERVNGSDWPKVLQGASPALLHHYRSQGFARRHITFADMLVNNMASELVRRVGLFRPFAIYVRAHTGSLPEPTAPWKNRGVRLCLSVHPEDEAEFYARLIGSIVAHNAYRLASDAELQTLDATLYRYDASQRRHVRIDPGALDPKVLLGLLMAAEPYQIAAVIERLPPGRRRVSPRDKVFVPRHERLAAEEAAAAASAAGLHSQASKAAKKQARREQRHRLVRGAAAASSSSSSPGSQAVPTTWSSLPWQAVHQPHELPPVARELIARIAQHLTDGAKEGLAREAAAKNAALGQKGGSDERGKNEKKKKKRQQQQRGDPGKGASGPLTHEAAKRRLDQLVAGPMNVAQAVQTAVFDDSLYAGSPSAEHYWRERGVDIGQLMNAIVDTVQPNIADIDTGCMLKRSGGGNAAIAAELGGGGGGASWPSSSSGSAVALDETASVKILSSAMIGAPIWGWFKEFTGYYGTSDDGGNDLGPSATLAIARRYRSGAFLCTSGSKAAPPLPPPAHASVLLAPSSVAGKAASPVLDRAQSAEAAAATTTLVLVRRAQDHHCHRFGACRHGHVCRSSALESNNGGGGGNDDVSDDESSSSSEDEDAKLLHRALRGKRGRHARYPHRRRRRRSGLASGGRSSGSESDSDSGSSSSPSASSSSSSGSESDAPPAKRVDEVSTSFLAESPHRNFLDLMSRAKGEMADLLSRPCLVLVPGDRVLDADNMKRVIAAVENKASDHTYGAFVRNYAVPLRSARDFEDIARADPRATLRLVSTSRVVYSVSPGPKRRLVPREDKAQRFARDDPRLAFDLSTLHQCRGYPANVRFVVIGTLHTNFAKSDAEPGFRAA